MKKFIIPFFLALALAAPLSASAFSYSDILNYGKKIFFKTEKKAPEKTAVQKAEEAKEKTAVLLSLERLKARRKYESWKKAYDKKDLDIVYADSDNFSITESELNYIISRVLEDEKNPPARDVAVDFSSDGTVEISGYSNKKNLKGEFDLKIMIRQDKKKIYPKVLRARLGKIPMPAFIAEAYVRHQTADAINFLYSGEKQSWSATINEETFALQSY
jgi:hypothetical protein